MSSFSVGGEGKGERERGGGGGRWSGSSRDCGCALKCGHGRQERKGPEPGIGLGHKARQRAMDIGDEPTWPGYPWMRNLVSFRWTIALIGMLVKAIIHKTNLMFNSSDHEFMVKMRPC